MHAVARFRTLKYAELERLIVSAAKRDVGLHTIHPFYEGTPARPGLMLGFAGLGQDQSMTVMELLGISLNELV